MTVLDWLVVAAYMLGMLVVGWHYGRATQNADEYLLGGRHMRATPIGLSLFASMLSTISYLARPGEMIQHGPMMSAEMLLYPIAFLIVGYIVIPHFMKQRVTSANEILEQRFGLSMRLLGAILFLAIRVVWMGIIIYVTTSQIIVPLAGLPTKSTPFVCVVVGLITVTYTSVGGLRAVVVTDVIQTLVLLCGSICALIVITTRLGGASQIWPDYWPEHWDKFHIGIQTDARATVLAACIAGMTWWICTASSDQIAIQRYLATKNASTARTALGVSLIASMFSTVLLGIVGLALLAYFRSHPDQLPVDVDINQNADRLFPHFIVLGLPTGLTGLTIAGLLAAAMSSLSSGVNSVCSVISVDFFDRLGGQAVDEAHRMRRTKLVSWFAGTAAVILSTVVGSISGNLIEISFKGANLLVGALYMLFFMTMYVPWATWTGTVAAALASTLAAVGVAYFEIFGIGFIWTLPVSVAAGITVGLLVSLLSLGTTADPLG